MKTRISTLITAIALTFTLISSVFAQGLRLEEGTPLTLRLQQELSSSTAQPGQTVTFEVVDEVKIGNTVVIAEGAIATGTIVEVEAKRRLGRAGKLAFRLDYVKAVNGAKVPIRATSINKGKGEGVTTGVLVGGAALVFLPAAPLFLLIKGKDITVPKGQRIDAFIDSTRTLQLNDESNFSSEPTTAVSYQTGAPAGGRAIVNIISEMEGGEIEVDGVFYGNAPSTVKLTPGQHTIIVKRPGAKPWVRTINLAPGTITVKVEPEKSSRRSR